MRAYVRSRKFLRTRWIPAEVAPKNAQDYPYGDVWRDVVRNYHTHCLWGLDDADKKAIGLELQEFLKELRPLFVAAVDRIESNPDMRLPLLRLLVIGDTSTPKGINRLAIELADMLSHSQCFWLRPLMEREKDYFRGGRTAPYSTYLFKIASELNSKLYTSQRQGRLEYSTDVWVT